MSKNVHVMNVDAAKLVDVACKFESRIMIVDHNKDAHINAKSLMGVMLLAAKLGADGVDLEICTEGNDAEAALEAIEICLTSK